MKTIFGIAKIFWWTVAGLVLVGTALYLIFRSVQVSERPDITQNQLARRLEHFANNQPVWRLSVGTPTDCFLCSTQLPFTNTFLLNTEELVQWRVEQRGHLFYRMVACTNKSRLERWLEKYRRP